MEFYRFNTPLLEMAAAAEDDAIIRLWLPGLIPDGLESKETPLLTNCASQVCDYLMGMRDEFDLPVRAVGTTFQTAVWNALCKIPYGQVKTYGQIAEEIGSPHAARAVGAACHVNPVPIIIPCHRVLNAKRQLHGYAGGLELKSSLLRIENSYCSYTIGSY